jgi:hypothetical protein
VSPDPVLHDYWQGDPNAGVYSPENLHLYTYAWNSPVVLRDPEGACPNCVAAGVGAGVGAAVGGGAYLFHAWRSGKFSWRGLAGAAGGGAVTGAIAGFTAGGSLLVQGTVAAGGAVAGGIVSRGIETGDLKQTFDPKAIGTDAIVGLVTFGIAKGGAAIITKGLATETGGALAGAARRALAKMGPGKGPVYGTKAHTVFEEEVKALGRNDLSTEVSYLNGKEVARGTKGSVRLDVVEGPKDNPTAVYDFKTGGAELTPQRVQEIRGHLPPSAQNIPITEVRGD